MRISRRQRKARGRRYPCFKAHLRVQEGRELLKVSRSWTVQDVDPKGYAMLRAPSMSRVPLTGPSVRTSFRFYGSREEWDRFRELCRERGSNTCHVLNDFVQAVLSRAETILEPGTVNIVNYWASAPRGHGQELSGEVRGVV